MAAPYIKDPAKSAELNARIAAMIATGVTVRAAAERLGLSHPMVRSRVTRMRMAGKIPMFKPKGDRVSSARRYYAMTGKCFGKPSALFAALTRDEADWLYKITPEGATVLDTIASIVRDAYVEETSGD